MFGQKGQSTDSPCGTSQISTLRFMRWVTVELPMKTTSAVTHYPTEIAAAMLGAAPQTPRASLCRRGHWLGMRPTKLPNGRLLWPVAEIERLLAGDVKVAGHE